jgi:hypothetical protein
MNYRKLIRDSKYSGTKVAELLTISRSTLDRFLDDPSNANRSYVKEALEKLFSTNTNKKSTPNEVEELAPGTSKMDRRGNLNASMKLDKSISGLSLREVVKLFDLDTEKWRCTGYSTKSWDTTMKGPNSEPVTHRNYSASAKFEPINQVVLKPDEVRAIFEEISTMDKKYIEPEYIDNKKENTLVLPILDAHIGKLAWGKETGENYDIKIGIARFRYAVKNLLSRASTEGFNKIIFTVG